MTEETTWERDYRDAQQQRRRERLPIRQQEIESLTGVEVKKLNEYQFRVNGKIDLYPIHHRYHILKSGKRGSYKPGELQNVISKLITT
jgi:hypothetical protein